MITKLNKNNKKYEPDIYLRKKNVETIDEADLENIIFKLKVKSLVVVIMSVNSLVRCS